MQPDKLNVKRSILGLLSEMLDFEIAMRNSLSKRKVYMQIIFNILGQPYKGFSSCQDTSFVANELKSFIGKAKWPRRQKLTKSDAGQLKDTYSSWILPCEKERWGK